MVVASGSFLPFCWAFFSPSALEIESFQEGSSFCSSQRMDQIRGHPVYSSLKLITLFLDVLLYAFSDSVSTRFSLIESTIL